MTHPNNALYVTKWRETNKDKSIRQNKDSMQRYYTKNKEYIKITRIFRNILL